MVTPLLSIIIPAHNEENRLPGTLDEIWKFLQTQSYSAEILVVENASTDGTLEVCREYSRRIPSLKCEHLAERGKGLAVKHGMLAAGGDYCFFADADLSMPIKEINRFIPPLLADMDVAIASREAKGAIRYGEPAYRHLIGRIFNSMVRVLVLPGLQDTQCGFKCFRRDVARDVFSRQTFTGMSFDAEVLFIARQLGWRIAEIPIPWYFNPDSRVRLVDDSLRMAMDLLTIRRNARKGIYQ